jgi:hypothetical protein
MQLIRGARPPRARFDAPRVERFTVRATKPNGSSDMVARSADEAFARTRKGARAPQSYCIVPTKLWVKPCLRPVVSGVAPETRTIAKGQTEEPIHPNPARRRI